MSTESGSTATLSRRRLFAIGGSAAGRSTTKDPLIAAGADASDLTVTVGVGRGILSRLGIKVPAALADLPAFEGDELEDAHGGGDVIVQICAEDPLVVASADRALRRLAAPTMTTRWQETGFQGDAGRAEGRNGRNLMGQIDGSNNVSTSPLAPSGPVWVDSTDPAWMTGGSYLVVRRIRCSSTPGSRRRSRSRNKSSDAPSPTAHRSAPTASPTPSTSTPADPTGNPSSPTTVTYVSQRREKESRCTGGAIPTAPHSYPTAPPTRDCSSSPTRKTPRPASYRSSVASPHTTP